MLLTTPRLTVRNVCHDDAEFIIALLNSEAFILNVGSRGVNTIEQAIDKIDNYYMAGYPNYGLFVVELTDTGEAIGTVSYLKRDYLEHDDIGYAFLPEFWNKGYAVEATKAVLDFKLNNGVDEVYGVVNKDNEPSIKLLKKLDFDIIGEVVMEGEDTPIYKMAYRPQS